MSYRYMVLFKTHGEYWMESDLYHWLSKETRSARSGHDAFENFAWAFEAAWPVVGVCLAMKPPPANDPNVLCVIENSDYGH